jgi:hypothetical protein
MSGTAIICISWNCGTHRPGGRRIETAASGT